MSNQLVGHNSRNCLLFQSDFHTMSNGRKLVQRRKKIKDKVKEATQSIACFFLPPYSKLLHFGTLLHDSTT